MRKHIYFLLSLLLCGIMILASCAKNGEGGNMPAGDTSDAGTSSKIGMFVQSIISPQIEESLLFTSLHMQEDGRLLLVGQNENALPRAFVGNGDGDWNELSNTTVVQYMSDLPDAEQRYYYTVTSDGIWWLGINHAASLPGIMQSESSDTTNNINVPELVKLTSDGQSQNFNATPSGASPDDVYAFLKILPGSGGVVYALLSETYNFTKVYWVAFDGETGKEIAKVELSPQNHNATNAVLKNSTLYVPNIQTNQIEIYSMLDGSKVDSFTIPELNFGMESIRFDIAENGDFCYADSNGIHRITQGGTLVQDMVNDTRFIFASPGFGAQEVIACADGSYLLVASDNMTGTSNVYRFVFDEDATVSAENSLKIWALTESHVLRAALAEYSNTYPDIYVSVEYGRTGDATGTTDADIIRTLNTRMLAGDVPDVLILDGLPINAYIGREMLTDLNGLVDISGCYENIMQAYTQDGKVYGYPALFQMPLFVANANDERARGIETLADLATIAKEQQALHYGNYAEMFESLYAAYGNEIFPKGAEVNETALQDFLENTKAISDALQLTSEIEYLHGGVSNPNVMPRQGLYSFIERNSRYAADIIGEPVAVNTMFSFNGLPVFSPLPGGAYIPVCGAAIPVDAANTEKALDFIELIIQSDTVQDLRMEQGFSVRIGQHLAFYERAAERNGSSEENNPANYDWDSLIASFTSPAIIERTLYLELYEQAERLYRGENSLDEAVGNVFQTLLANPVHSPQSSYIPRFIACHLARF